MGFFGFLFAIHAVDTLRGWVRPADDADDLTDAVKELTASVIMLNVTVRDLDSSIKAMKK